MEDRTVIAAGAPPSPSPSEVKIRTMRSDLASMAKSGGGMPHFENVAVSNLSIEKKYTTPTHAPNLGTPTAAASIVQAPPRITIESGPPKKDIYPILIVIIVALFAIGGVGYFAYATFFAGSSSNTSPTATQTPTSTLPAVAAATTTTTTSPSPSSVPVVSPVAVAPSQTATLSASDELSSPHSSLFKKPADQIITVNLSGVNASTYQKTMSASLSTASAISSMIEIDPKVNDGNSVNLQGLFSVAGASILNQQAIASFDPDATFFVYRDKNGLWPGYVIALAAGQTSSSLAADIQQLEQSTSIGNLFLTNSGNPSSDGFTDSITAGVHVRVLPFSGTSFPLYFSYGWYGSDLILSTSNNGFAAAVADLQ